MITTVKFPIKGTYYYDAKTALQSGELVLDIPLKLQAEPNNPHDSFAIQIWLINSPQLLGYIPKTLAKSLTPYLSFQKIHLVKSKKKGQYIALTAEMEINCSHLQAVKIFWLATYVCWRYKIESLIRRTFYEK